MSCSLRLLRSRWATLSVECAAVALIAGLVISVAAAAGTPFTAPNVAAPPSAFDQLRLTALAAQSSIPQHSLTAEALADRAQSATRYGGLSAAAAVEVLRERVPEAVHQPAFRPLELPSGARVSGFADDDHLASLRTANGNSLVLASSMPLRTIDRNSGLLAPVDLGLESQNAGRFQAFMPVNDPVPIRFPTDLSEGITVGAIGVRLDGVRGAAAQQIDDTVVWPNALDDVDAVARAVGPGVDVSLILRSEASPEAFPLSFDVPAGTTVALRAPALGGPNSLGLVDPSGTALGTLSAPVAWDADHVPVPVPVQWQVQNGKATLLVPHSGRDIAWPIVVDPQISDARLINDDRPAGYLAAHPWTWSNTPGFGAYYDTQMNQYTPYTNFAGTAFSWWEVNLAGRQASILQIHADGESHSTSSGPASCSYINIYFSDVGTEYPWAPDCSNYAGRSENVGDWTLPWNGHRGDKAIVGEYVDGPGVRWAAQGVTGLVLALRDDDLPAVTITGPSTSSGWANGGLVSAAGDDEGVGIKQLTLTADGSPAWSGATTVGPACLPTGAVCPTIVGTGGVNLGDLPEGVQTLRANATDPVSHAANAGTIAVKYDHTAPAIGQFTGTLYDNRDTSFGDARAVRIPLSGEGSTATQSQRRSGVRQIRLIVDGTNVVDQRTFAQQDSWVPTSTGTDNVLQVTGSLLSLGTHTVVADVTDWAGNTRSSSPFSRWRLGT